MCGPGDGWIIVPGGFGREQKEKFKPSSMREQDVPMLCLLGDAVDLYQVCPSRFRLEGANSSELDPETKYPIIDIMRDQIDVEDMGGTFVSVFTLLNSNEDQKQQLPMTIKKWYNVFHRQFRYASLTMFP